MAILGTTNCFLIPRDEYQDRMFTTGPVRLHWVPNSEEYDYSAVIAKARSLPKLKDEPGDYELTTGFSTSVILSLKDKIKQLVQEGKI